MYSTCGVMAQIILNDPRNILQLLHNITVKSTLRCFQVVQRFVPNSNNSVNVKQNDIGIPYK